MNFWKAKVLSATDYWPFGQPLAGRQYEANRYRYGMNGQEKVDEINNVVGGHYTAQFWEYDSRLARRWNVDPKPNVWESMYACFGDNPILNVDVNGDDWYVGMDKKSQSDAKSIIGTEFQKYVSINSSGKVELKFNQSMSADDVKKAIDSDAGLSLVNNLVNSKNNYLYEAKGDNNGRALSSVHGTIENNSVEPRMEYSKADKLPKGFQGQVIIHPDAEFTATNGQEENRASVVFHELQENYERTDNKLKHTFLDPTNKGKEDFSRKGAHGTAIDKSNKLAPNARSVSGGEGNLNSAKIK